MEHAVLCAQGPLIADLLLLMHLSPIALFDILCMLSLPSSPHF